MSNTELLIASCLAMVFLVVAVGVGLLFVRTNEMRERRVHPQSASTSLQMAARLQNVQAADNFKNLFEVPVWFYALAAIALAVSHAPSWLVAGAWLFVALRVAHSYIHCRYNKVMHRFPVFILGFAVVVVLWLGIFLTLPKNAL